MSQLSSTSAATRLFSRLTPYALIAPPVLVMALLIIYPALISVFDTITSTADDGTLYFTLENYVNFFSLPDAWPNLWFTLRMTIITVGILFAVCFPIAYYLRFATSRIAGPVQFLALFPMFVPGIITAFALIRFLDDNGWVENSLFTLFNGIAFLIAQLGGGETALHDFFADWRGYTSPIRKPMGIIVGLVWEGIPVTLLILMAGFAQVPNALIESARDVGANRLQIFTRIILPLIRRPVLIVLTLNFLGVFGAFTIPLLLGGASPQMYGHYMQNRLYGTGQYTNAQVAAVVMFIISAAVGMLYVRSIVSQRIEEGAGS